MVRVSLFGTPRIERDGRAIPLRRRKAIALLAYLAVAAQPQDRDALLALLWPEFGPGSARNNLRRELSLLKSALDDEILVADRRRVGWNTEVATWLDVAAFRGLLAEAARHDHRPGELCAACAESLAAAVRLHVEDFMAGFTLPDCPAFDEWQFFQREELRRQLAQALQSLVGWHAGRGSYGDALAHARRWVALDPLHEPARREVMQLYAWSGQRSAALRQYDECVRALDEELGVEPEAETTELFLAIKARRLPPPREVAATPPVADPRPTAPLHNLPTNAGFVGRRRELADIIRRLTDPTCRLLTLAGPGGIGKTRLALEVARAMAEEVAGDSELADGVLFVPLTAVDTLGGLVSALAAAARFEFYPSVPPHQQVLDFFRTRRMLLVLDNFEQLLDETGFLGELLAAAPGLRLLVTSRAALSLREEWFHPVEGLAVPGPGETLGPLAQLARYDAVRLFEQRARMVRSDFSLSAVRSQVVRLCRLVDGMPLAIELAASWLKVLTVDQVLAALDRGLDILTARDRDILARHRSMRTVIEESWRLLPEAEREVLAGLSVFRGSFSAAAAAEVVGASLGSLANLVEHSLLRNAAGGRFQLHELLRQFMAERLAAEPQAVHALHGRHSAFYLAFVVEREGRLFGAHPRSAADEIVGEAENVRAA